MNLCCWGKAKPREEVRVSNDFFRSTTPECCHKASVTFKKPLSEQNLGGSHIAPHICFVENSLLHSPPLKICSLKTQGMFDFSRFCVSEFCILSDADKKEDRIEKISLRNRRKKRISFLLTLGSKTCLFLPLNSRLYKDKRIWPAENTTRHPT